METGSAKYKDNVGDTMVDDFVWIEPEVGVNITQNNTMEHRLIAGIAQVYATQPFDTIKVKQQTFPKTFKNMWQCFGITYRKHGIYRGLYAGTFPAVTTSIIENALLFGTYSGCQKAIANKRDISDVRNLSTLDTACAGGLSAVVATLLLCPSEVLKCKLQAIQEMKRYVEKGGTLTVVTPYKLTKRIFQNEGIAGFYRGLSSTFIRDIPGFFIYFGTYEIARDYFNREAESKGDVDPWKSMLAATVAGIVQCISTFPLDVIKSRIQIHNLKNRLPTVALDILKNDGVAAFYSGLLPSILRTIPATGAVVLVYENHRKSDKW